LLSHLTVRSQTRAIRRRLTKFEAGKVTRKQQIKLQHFPKRAFAVKE
jgi:large subunit ribosomal protein L35e